MSLGSEILFILYTLADTYLKGVTATRANGCVLTLSFRQTKGCLTVWAFFINVGVIELPFTPFLVIALYPINHSFGELVFLSSGINITRKGTENDQEHDYIYYQL